MILITGASGQLGSSVIRHLLKQIPASGIAALVRNKEKAAELIQMGVEVRVGDYQDINSLKSAFKGIDELVLISSSDFNDRFGQHRNAVEAAQEAGIRHILYTGVSMKNPETSAIGPMMDDHYKTEDLIKASGIPYTIFRNGLYADIVPMFIGEKVAETGVFLPAGEGRTAFAVRDEIGEAIANVMSSEGHINQTYEITGSETYSFEDVAANLSKIFAKDVPYISPDSGTYKDTLGKAGVPEMIIGVTAGFSEAISKGHFSEVHASLEKLLGRKPLDLASYLHSVYQQKAAQS